ncbi:MAG: FG-GAP-like repeat-containing protein [Pyrinomonadaceae bacterium]
MQISRVSVSKFSIVRLLIAAFIFAGIIGIASMATTSKGSDLLVGLFGPTAEAAPLDTLQGDAAIAELKRRGLYDSLADAMRATFGHQQIFHADINSQTGAIIEQQAYVKASNTAGDDHFGISVAISADTVVVGAEEEDSNATGVNGDQNNNLAGNSGAAYVFIRSGATWSQQAYLKPSNTDAGDRFGFSIAISGDTIVISASLEDSNATGVNGDQSNNSASEAGAAYVFTRSGTTWSQQAYLKASNTAAFDRFGNSVSVSGDTVVVGAFAEDSNATGVGGDQSNNSASNAGAAYVFTRSGTTWTQQAYLKASNTESGDTFGETVSVSGDTVVVGADAEDSSATGVDGDQGSNSSGNSGATYVFTRSGSTWSQQAYLKASNTGADDRFGTRVSVSGDTVVVVADAEDSNATSVNGDQGDNSAPNSGAAYIFTRSGTTWTQQAYLKASNAEAGDGFGDSVAVSGDTVVLGVRLEDSNATGVNGDQNNNSAGNSGAAYVFSRSGTTWTQQAYLKASNTGILDQFGLSVAVSGDTVVVGAFNEDSNATGVNGDQSDNSEPASGAAYVFGGGGGPTPTPTATPTASPTATPISTSLGTYPDTSVAMSDNITITPDAAPTDTTRITVSAPTSFIGELEADPMTGDVRVTNAALANTTPGTYEITVTAFGPGGTATAIFDLTVTDPPPCAGLDFSPAVNYGTGRLPNNVTIGDFNGDGDQDLLTLNSQFGTGSVLLGNGDGTFADAVDYSVGLDPFSVAVGDFNGDGIQDLAVANELDLVSILLGNGDGTFAALVAYPTPDRPTSVVVGDFNEDGIQDLVTAGLNSDNVSVLLGNGDGTFADVVTFAVGDGPLSVVVGDFNGDGNQDLAATNGISDDISILLGNGNGTFADVVNFPVDDYLRSVVVGDLNGDGIQDLAAANPNTDNIAVLLGIGDGTFADAVNYEADVNPRAVAIGDLNGDGIQDLAAPNFDSDNVSILLGHGDGTFATAVNFAEGVDPRSIAIGDFDGDGNQDIATDIRQSHNVSVLLRNCGTPTPTPTPTPNTPTGSNVTVAAPSNDANVTFSQVTTFGTTTFTPISPPSSAGTPPPGYTILDSDPAYDITTTAAYTPPVTVCFTVSSINDAPTFSRVRVLHGEGGPLVDRTILPPNEPAPDFPTRRVCANVDSLSPFVLALAPEAGMGFENDVTPRANGDGIVISGDVIQMRRFATGLDTASIDPNEYQRADSAPRATFGDGLISSGDVIQARRYATGLDPATPASGPTGPPMMPNAITRLFEDVYAYFFGREIRVTPMKPTDDGLVTVAVEITSYGDEVAAGFTLEYDAAKLSNPQITLAEGAPDRSILTVNADQAGRIGILVDSTEAFVASAVPKRFLTVTFDVVSGSTGETAISLTDDLAARGTADANGNTLNVRYVDGSVDLAKFGAVQKQ